jgi:chromosome partitioning protein
MNVNLMFLTQRIMAEISKEHPSTVNRYIANTGIPHVQTGTKRNLKYSIASSIKILSHFVAQKKKAQKKVWAFYNFKGGTGKTSFCFQISSLLAMYGYKVLVIDVDPQGNLSNSLGFDISENFLTLYDVITKGIPAKEAIKHVFPGYDCLPSNIACSRFDMELSMMGRREEQFKFRLQSLKDEYDFILFDTNPNISYIIRNILMFCDLLCVPCETQSYSVNALGILFEDMGLFFNIMEKKNPEIIVVPNKYEERYGSSAEAMTVLRKNFPEYLISDFAVRKAEDFNIAAKEGLPLPCVAKKNSIALQDIVDLTQYLLNKTTTIDV